MAVPLTQLLLSQLQQTCSTQRPHVATGVNVGEVAHPLVACDVCDRPIVGVRYKCGLAAATANLRYDTRRDAILMCARKLT